MLVTLLTAAVLASPAPAAPPPKPLEVSAATRRAIAWSREALHLSGWRLASASPELLIFIKPGVSAVGAAPQLMVRGEHYPLAPSNPIGSGESFLNIGELDCTGGRERTLHATIYGAVDLQGAIVAGSDDAGPWEKIASGSPVASALPMLCGTSAPGVPAAKAP